MKKRICLFVFILLLLSLSLLAVTAQEEPEAEISGVSANAPGFQESTNKILESEITIPENLRSFAKLLFGLKDDAIAAQNLIILFALWIILLLIIQAMLEIMPFFGEGWKSWAGAVIVTALISVTGAIQSAAVWFFDLRTIFSKIGKYGFFFLVLNLIILAFFAWGARYLIKIIKHKIKKEVKYREGLEQGAGI